MIKLVKCFQFERKSGTAGRDMVEWMAVEVSL